MIKFEQSSVTSAGSAVIGFATAHNEFGSFPTDAYFEFRGSVRGRNMSNKDYNDAFDFHCRQRDGDKHSKFSYKASHLFPVRFARQSANSIFVAVVIGFSSLIPSPQSADAAEVVINDSQLSTQAAYSKYVNPVFVADASNFTIVEGWQSSLGGHIEASPRVRASRSSADRGFDPTTLEYNILDLVATTVPDGHDLLPVVPTTDYHEGRNSSPVAEQNGEESTSAEAFRLPNPPNSQGSDLGEDDYSESGVFAASDGNQGLSATQFRRPVLRPGARQQSQSSPRESSEQGSILEINDDAQEQPLVSLEGEHITDMIFFNRPVRRPSSLVAVVTTNTFDSVEFIRPLRRPNNLLTTNSISVPIATVTSSSRIDEGNPSAKTTAIATTDTQLDLTKINLIGIHGNNNYLRALVRLPNGKFANLYEGGAFNGGIVREITSTSVTYVRRGKSYTLTLPF